MAQTDPTQSTSSEGESPPSAKTPTLLAIETSHRQGSVALDTGSVMAVELLSPGLVHGRELLPTIARLTRSQSTTPSDLVRIAVSAGPGSYTGIRIGVSTAKAIAWSLGIPALPISSLETVAHAFTKQDKIEAGREFAVVGDGRRSTAYFARFRIDSGVLVRTELDQVWPVEQICETLPRETLVIGSGLETLTEFERFECRPGPWNHPDAGAVLELAQKLDREIRSGRANPPPGYDDPHQLVPAYLRPSEAEERRLKQ